MLEPCLENDFQAEHAALILVSFRELAGFPLVEDESAEGVYHAPFPILTQTTDADPIMSYGNRAVQDLFEMDWSAFTKMPSRLVAEPGLRAEREAMFEKMRETGWIDNYEGIRVSATGKRFKLRNAFVWTVTDPLGNRIGEAATFKDITPLET